MKKYLQEESKTEWRKTMKYFLNKCRNFTMGDGILLCILSYENLDDGRTT